MRHLGTIILAALCVIMSFACGGRTAGGDGNDNFNNTNENVNQNNNNQEDYLTRRILVQNTINELLGYQLDLGEGCVSPATDVHPEQGLQEQVLCWALDFAEKLMVMVTYPDGDFRPENTVVRAEMWAVVDRALGFYPFPGSVSSIPDVPSDSWFAGYASTLSDKGLLILQQDGASHPSDNVPLHEWYSMMASLQTYLSQAATRRHVLEALAAKFFYGYSMEPCESIFFNDVTDNSLLCYVSDVLVDEGLLDPGMNNLGPDRSFNWAEFAKMILMGADRMDLAVATGCSGTDPMHWGGEYMDALCELGILPPEASATAPMSTVKVMLKAISDFEIAIYVPPVSPSN